MIRLTDTQIWEGKNINPTLLLIERERRARIGAFLSKEYKAHVVSISLNIPGTVRDNNFFRYLLQMAKNEVLYALKKINAQLLCSYSSFNGQENYILLCVGSNVNARLLKEKTIEIETTHALGRIFDLDVISSTGIKLERKEKRKCIVCGGVAIVCRREKKHTLSEILSKFREIVEPFFNSFIEHHCTPHNKLWSNFQAIIAGILLEVSCTPKPGLVNRERNGSHYDMNYELFLKSTQAIAPFLYEMMLYGYNYHGSLNHMLQYLRSIGLRAEQAMFDRTKGVNTQKGLIFSAGLIAASAGLLTRLNIALTFSSLRAIIKKITSEELQKELKEAVKEKRVSTAGLSAYVKYRITGIRGEVTKGYPSVVIAKRDLEEKIKDGYKLNEAMLQALFRLISIVEDTTIIKRGGIEALYSAQELAKRFLKNGGVDNKNAFEFIQRINNKFIERNWTVGGCADLLAVTVMIYLLENPTLLKNKEIITRKFKLNISPILEMLESRLVP